MSFKNLNLHATIISTLEIKGYNTPTPIQSQSIPHLLEGKDLMGIAQTGTGKTAAFSLPILHNLTENKAEVKSRNIRALILTPTRELASQILDSIDAYGKNLDLKYAAVFGGVSINTQIKHLVKGLDILVATPGRLLDLMNQGYVKYEQLEIFVLDEADRMLDMGFIIDVKKIIAKLPQKRQTLFFSATMSKEIAALANAILKDPIQIEITPESTTVEKIDQKVNLVDKSNKILLLKAILENPEVKTVLVFCSTKHGANRIVKNLEQGGISVSAIHGNKSQAARESALDGFKSGKYRVLVATDIAARGIDVPGVTHVINYDIPRDSESYVHRIGRTARAGKSGHAISFCDRSEQAFLRKIEKLIKYQIPIDDSHPLHGAPAREVQSSELFKTGHGNSRSSVGGRKPMRTRFEGSENREGNFDRKPPRFGGRPEGQREERREERREGYRPEGRSDRSSDSRGGGYRDRRGSFEKRNDSGNFNSEETNKPRSFFGIFKSNKPESSEGNFPRERKPFFGRRDDNSSRPDNRGGRPGGFGGDRRSESRSNSSDRGFGNSGSFFGRRDTQKSEGGFGGRSENAGSDRRSNFNRDDRARSGSFDRKPRSEGSEGGYRGSRTPSSFSSENGGYKRPSTGFGGGRPPRSGGGAGRPDGGRTGRPKKW